MLFRRVKRAVSDYFEKRTERRIQAQDEFLVEFKKRKEKKYKLEYGQDISLSGIRFAANVKLGNREKLNLVIYFSKKFPGRKKLQVHAKVARCLRLRGAVLRRIGCRLDRLDKDSKDLIREYLDWLRTQPDFAIVD